MAERFSDGGSDAETVGNIPVRRDPSYVVYGAEAGLPAGRLVVFRALTEEDFGEFVAEVGTTGAGDFIRAYQAVERSEDGTGVVGAYRVTAPGQEDSFFVAEIIDRPQTPGYIGMNDIDARDSGAYTPHEGHRTSHIPRP